MKASETKLIRIIEGTNQYLVPHFQRPYTWQKKNWETLWVDIVALTPVADAIEGGGSPPEHFMGAMVTAPAHSVPEGVTKYLLIDGQQRLTTLLIFLAAIRDQAKATQDEKLASRIQEMYLTNRYQDGLDQYKLLPTQGNEPTHNDRTAFLAIMDGVTSLAASSGTLHAAFQYFARALRDYAGEQLSALMTAIVSRVFLVSIVLERDDNPYSIFESLNAKGQPLSQADLVRNFFFMSIDAERHDEIYRNKWIPIETAIERENMEAYVRHFLIREGSLVKESNVYYTLKKRVEDRGRERAESVLDDLLRVSKHYACFLFPEKEHAGEVRRRLIRLQRLRATVCYPFLLKVFEDRAAGRVDDNATVTILDVIENFIVRRYVCGTIRAELNELFTSLHRSASRFSLLAEGVKEVLGSRNYPTDEEFSESLQARKLYGAGEVRDRAKLILERLEQSWPSKEEVGLQDLTIEHLMPQTLTAWWREHLGQESDEVHQLHLHTIGNLTLTGYNAELSNSEWPKKRELLRQSKLSINTVVATNEAWRREEIELRAMNLATRALEIWPNFAPQAAARRALAVRGTTPRQVTVLGKTHPVETWQDVLKVTLTQVRELGDDVFVQVAREFPRYVKNSEAGLRSPRKLADGAFYESHLNAEQIHRLCSQVVQQAGLSAPEWHVDMA